VAKGRYKVRFGNALRTARPFGPSGAGACGFVAGRLESFPRGYRSAAVAGAAGVAEWTSPAGWRCPRGLVCRRKRWFAAAAGPGKASTHRL